MKKEAHVKFLTDPLDSRSKLKPAGVMAYEGKHACVNLIGVSPLVKLGVGPFTVRQTVLKVALSKVAKQEKTCSYNQHAFIPFALDLLHNVQKVVHNNVM